MLQHWANKRYIRERDSYHRLSKKSRFTHNNISKITSKVLNLEMLIKLRVYLSCEHEMLESGLKVFSLALLLAKATNSTHTSITHVVHTCMSCEQKYVYTYLRLNLRKRPLWWRNRK